MWYLSQTNKKINIEAMYIPQNGKKEDIILTENTIKNGKTNVYVSL